MAAGKKVLELHKPPKKDLGFVDILSADLHSTLRYYFVKEETVSGKIEDTCAARIENLLRLTLASHEKAAAAFQEVLIKWKSTGPKTIDSIRQLNQQYEEVVLKHVEKSADPPALCRISAEDLDYILTLIHDRVIENIEALNDYKPWTHEVYGETSFGFAKKMFDELKLCETDTFLDLGSGVGRVVMQVAALFHCKKSVGIELMDNRASFASDMDMEFRSLMAWLGYEHGEYKLIHGDFRKFVPVIGKSNVIFCNNFAFEEELNFELKGIFADKLQPKSRILVSKSLRDEKFRITEKTQSDGAAVLPVRRTFQGKMSWTDNPVTFSLHEVDWTTLARFTESRSDPTKRAAYDEEQRQLRPKYYESSSEQSQDVDPDGAEDENQNPTTATGKRGGCTTRSQWKTSVKRRRVTNDNTESDDDDSESPNSEASTQRTRSIPSQDSTSRTASNKRKRGRPVKGLRSAPSSASDSALQALYAHTVKGINTIDRSLQPGCMADVVYYAPSDDLPPEYQSCLRNIETAMRAHHRAVQSPDHPAQLQKRIHTDNLKMQQLRGSQKRLQAEVVALRGFCKKLLEAMFNARNLPLPHSTDDLSRDSSVMLKDTTSLRERSNTLKDDIHWLETAHVNEKAQHAPEMLALNGKYPGKMTPSFQHVNGGHGTASPSPFSARQTQAMPHHQQVQGSPAPSRAQPTGSASQPREFVKPRAADAAPDAMDLSRVHKREGPIGRGLQSYDQALQASHAATGTSRKDPPPRHPYSTSQGAPGHGKHQQAAPSSAGPPNFMSELGRVIESSLLGPSTSSSSRGEPAAALRNEGNLRGLSPSVHPRQQQQRPDPSPSRQEKTASSSSSQDSPARQYPAAPRASAQQSATPYMVPTQENMGRIVHGQIVYPGIVGTGQPFPTSQMPGAAVYGDYPGLAGPVAFNPQNFTVQPDPRGHVMQAWPPHQFSSGVNFDSSQITASLAGAFSGIPGASSSGATYPAGKYSGPPGGAPVGFEAISPPPR